MQRLIFAAAYFVPRHCVGSVLFLRPPSRDKRRSTAAASALRLGQNAAAAHEGHTHTAGPARAKAPGRLLRRGAGGGGAALPPSVRGAPATARRARDEIEERRHACAQ
ncbi:uncharacterized protein Tco025E_09806 [Trypanosoma conorhini]|uniref:Uncharacterized protein n=1 Tax=Trypanosoma conorhini TaxID=83891 RepID=A0A422MSJ4_9TRYP|nr:uncharacterized protein Tco025E_09806 [Trypanosoma conorhini]RNE96170.1 hypothetical protein Tco025E_09806 [Trypanosoma conorhini]